MPDTYKNPAETGWYYCNSRYYDPAIGRWINADKYASTGVVSIGHNMFAYCYNNPVNLSDLTGTIPCACTLRPNLNVCLWCGRTSPEREKELSEKLNKENTPANPTQIPDEEIVMKEYTLTRTVDIMMAEAEFSVSVLDCYGEWIMATPTYEARLIEDKEFLSSPGFNYDIKVTNSTAYIEDKHLYLEVEFDITATFGISIDCFELAIPFGLVQRGNAVLVWEE